VLAAFIAEAWHHEVVSFLTISPSLLRDASMWSSSACSSPSVRGWFAAVAS